MECFMNADKAEDMLPSDDDDFIVDDGRTIFVLPLKTVFRI